MALRAYRPFVFLALAMFIIAGSSIARANSGVTYQGRIIKPDGNALEGTNVQFRIQVRTPGSENCLMFEEVQQLNMADSKGMFGLTIGNGTRADSTGYGLDTIFANRGTFTLDSATCYSGNSYAPNPDDGRKLVVYFKDETMSAWEPMPTTDINYVPFAFESKQIAGFTANSLLRVADGTTLGNVSPLSTANYNALLALIAGTSSQYQQYGKLQGLALPSLTNGQSLGWNGGTWVGLDPGAGLPTFAKTALPTCAAGEYLRDNGSGSLVCSTPANSGGTVTAVVAGAGLTGGTITTSGTIALPVLGAGGTAVKVTYDTFGRITAASSLSEADIPTLTTAGKVSGDAITSGQIGGTTSINTSGDIATSGVVSAGSVTAAKVTGTTLDTQAIRVFETTNNFKVTIVAPSTLAADYTMTLPGHSGSPGQVLTTTAGGTLAWANTAVTGITDLTGDVTATGTGSVGASLSTTGVGAGSYGSATQVPTFTVDAKGRLTAAGSVTISGTVPGGSAGGDLSGTYPNPTVAKIQGQNVNAGTLGPADAGKAFVWQGTEYQSQWFGIQNLKTTTGAAQFVDASCAANQTLTWSALTDQFTCTNIAGLDASTITTGTLSSARLPIVPIAKGGTNSPTALNNNRFVVSSGGAIIEAPALLDGQIFIGQTGGAPLPGTLTAGAGISITNGAGSITISASGAGATLNSGKILIGDASNVATEVTPAGDVTISHSGNTVITANAVTTSKIVNDAITSAKIADDSVTFAKLQNINTNRMLGRSTAAAGDVEEISLGAGLSLSNGTLAASGSGTSLNNGNILVGDASNIAQQVGVTGEVSLSNTGVTTIGNGVITNAKMASNAITTVNVQDDQITFAKFQNINTNRILGRSTAAAGDMEEIALGTGLVLSNGTLATSAVMSVTGSTLSSARIWVGDSADTAQPTLLSGDVTMSNAGVVTIGVGTVTTSKLADGAVTALKLATDAVTTLKIADDNVTFAKLQNINTNRMLGRSTAGAGDIEEITLGAGLSLAGGTLAASGSGTALTNSYILVGDAANLAQQVLMSGDVTISNTGVATITADAVSTTEIANLAVTTGKLADDNVTFAKIQNINTNRLVGRSSAAAGDIEELSLGAGLTLSNGTLAATVSSVTGSTLTDARIWVGDSANTAQPVLVSGDLTMSNAGVFTISANSVTTGKIADSAVTALKLATDAVTTVKIADDQVTFAKFQNINTNRILGRSTAAAGDMEEIVLGAGLALANGTLAASGSGTALSNSYILVGDAANLAQQVLMSGDVTISNTGVATITADAVSTTEIANLAVTTGKLADDNVTFAKIQNINTNKLLGRSTAAAGDIEELSLGAGLTLTNGTLAATVSSVTGSTLTNTQIWVGDSANTAQPVALSGDATINNAGVVTITPNAITGAELASNAVTTANVADDQITFAKFQNINTNRILGRSTAAAGDMEEIQLGTGLTLSNGTLATSAVMSVTGSTLSNARIWVGDSANSAQPVLVSGDATLSNSGGLTIAPNAVTTSKIADDNVTFAKLQNINTNKMLGRSTAASGDIEEIALGAGLSLANGTLAASGSGTALANANILVGDVGGLAQQVLMSGDVTISNTGVATITANAVATNEIANLAVTTAKIADGSVTFVKLGNVNTNKLLGRSSAGAGLTEELSLGAGLTLANGTLAATVPAVAGSTLTNARIWVGDSANTAQPVLVSGDATLSNSGGLTITPNAVTTAKIADDQVTFAKFQNINTNRLLGRSTASAGDMEEIQIGGGMSLSAGTLGLVVGGGLAITNGTLAATGGGGDFYKDGSVSMTGNFKAVSGSSSSPGMAFSYDQDTGVYNAGANTLTLVTGGQDRLTITQNGNVGVGTSAPDYSLSLFNSNFSGINLGASSIAHGITAWGEKTTTGATFTTSATGGASLMGIGSDTLTPGVHIEAIFGSASPAAGKSAMTIEGTKKSGVNIQPLGSNDGLFEVRNANVSVLNILGSGAVGIGTTSPIAKLDVRNGAISAGTQSSTLGGEVRFYEAGSGGTNFVAFRAPAAIANDVVWYMPVQDGGANQVMVTNGAGSLGWASGLTNSLNAGNMFIGNNSNVATAVVMTGDATISFGGTLTIQNNAITNTKIADGAVTYAKQGNTSSGRLQGRYSAGSGVTEEIALGGPLTMSTGTLTVNIGAGLAISNGTLASTGLAAVAGSTLSNAQIWIGDSANTAQPVLVSGDVTMSNTGAVTIAANSVTTGKIANLAVTTAKVADDAVTFAKMQNINTNRLVGRYTASAGDMEEIQIGGGMSLSAGTLGLVVGGGLAITNGTLAATGGGGDFYKDGSVSMTGAFKAVSGNSSTPGVAFSYDQDTGMYNSGANTLAFSTGGQQRLTIDAIGNVGIGTSNPSYPLQVNGTVNVLNAPLYLSSGYGPTWGTSNISGTANSQIQIYTAGLERFRVDTSGNVGIGTTSPINKLDVFGGAIAAGSIGSGAGNAGQVRFYDLGASGNNFVAFRAADQISSDMIWTLPAQDGGANQVMVTNGAGSLGWASGLTNSLNAGNMLIGNNSNVATAVVMTGDATISFGGTLTIQNNAITNAKIADGAVTYAKLGNVNTNRLLGRSTAGAGITEEISLGSGLVLSGGSLSATVASVTGSTLSNAMIWVGNSSNTAQPVLITGDVTISNSGVVTIATGSVTNSKLATDAVTTVKVADDAVTFAKFQNINTGKILGRSTASAGDMQELDVGGGLILSQGTLGINVGSGLSVTNGTLAATGGGGDFFRNGSASMTGGFLAISGNSTTPGMAFSYDQDTGIYNPAANSIAIATSGFERFSIDSSGNAGIGTAPIGNTRFSIRPSSAGTAMSVTNTSGLSIVDVQASAGGHATFSVRDGSGVARFSVDAASGDMVVRNAGGGTVTYFTSSNPGYTLYNFGIGTSSNYSGTKLHVNGGAIAAGSIGSGSGNAGQVRFYDLGSSGNNFVAFRAPDQVSNDMIWTLPSADAGGAGYALISNGAGSLGWQSLAGGGDFFKNGSVSMTGQFRAITGSASMPGISFGAGTTTGLALNGSNMNLIAAGTQVGYVGSTGLSITDFAVGSVFLDRSGWLTASGGTTYGEVTSGDTVNATSGATVGQFSFGQRGLNANAKIQGVATENHAGAATGTALTFSTTINGSTLASERMRIDSNGSVGIGTTAPIAGSRLHVTGGAIGAGSIASGSGNAGQIRWYDLGASGNNYVAFRSPDQITNDVVWTLPSADAGGSNYALVSNGAGSLSWVSMGGGGDFMKNGSVSMTGQFLVVSGSSTSPGMAFSYDTNTGIYNPSADALSIATAGQQRAVFDSSGNFGVGVTPGGVLSPAAKIEAYSANTLSAPVVRILGEGEPTLDIVGANANWYLNPMINFNRSRGTTGSKTVPSNGDEVGAIYANVWEGGYYAPAASIDFVVDAAAGAGDTPGRIAFNTTPDGAAIAVERMRINNAGQVGIGTSSNYAGTNLQVTGGAIAAGSIGSGAGNAGQVRFYDLAMSGTNYVAFRAPDNVAVNTTWTLPSGDAGGSNYALVSNGAGSLSWVSMGGGGDFMRNGSTSMTAGQFLAVSGSSTSPGIAFSYDTDTGIYNAGANTLAFATGGLGRMTIDSSGNVGIGTGVPGNVLHVKANVNGSAIAKVEAISDTLTFGNFGSGTMTTTSSGALAFYSGASNNVMNFTSGGNVGIGTTTAAGKVSFGTASGTELINFYEGAAGNRTGIGNQTNGLQFYTATGNFFSFNTGGDINAPGVNEVMRITGNTGNVGIGTTLNFTGARLQATGGAIAAGSIGSGSGNAGQVRFYDLGTSGNNFVAFRAPDQITSDLVFTLPGTLAAANSVLMTDANGSLTWGTAGTGSGDFLRDGTLSMTGQFLAIGGNSVTPGIAFGGDTGTGMFRFGAGSIAWATNGQMQMVLGQGGRLGIGTTTPGSSTDLDVWGVNGIRTRYNGSTFGAVLSETASSDLRFNVGNGNRMVINSNGVISIGSTSTISSTNRLEATGGAIAANSIASGSGNGGQVRFYDLGASGNNFVAFRAPDQITSDMVWTLPSADAGGANYALVSNGAGSLSWASMGGGGDFMKNGSVSMTGQFLAISGSSTAPGMAFSYDTDTGVYSAGANTLAFSVGGVRKGYFDSAALYLNDGGVGVTESSAGTFAVRIGATNRHFFDGSRITSNTGHGYIIHNSAAVSFAPADSDSDTGLGWVGSNAVGLYSNNIPYLTMNNGVTLLGSTITTDATNRLEVSLGAIAAGSIGSGSGNAGQVRFYDLGASGKNFVAFRAPDQITSDLIFTLPGTLAAANSVLMTDALGSLTWGTAGSGSGDFFKNGSVTMTGQLRAISGSSLLPGISFGAGSNTGMYLAGANTLAFSTGGQERMRIDSNGWLGIGTLAPSLPLDVVLPGGQYMAGQFKGAPSGAGDVVVHIEAGVSTGMPTIEFKQPGYTSYQLFQRGSGGHNFYLNPGNDFNNPSSNSMVFTGAGQLGLGAGDTPFTGARLDVRGGAIAAGSIGSGSGNAGQVRFYDLGASGNNFVAFRAPDQITSDLVFTLPGTLGSANSVLMTDALGSLTWGAAGGSATWKQTDTATITSGTYSSNTTTTNVNQAGPGTQSIWGLRGDTVYSATSSLSNGTLTGIQFDSTVPASQNISNIAGGVFNASNSGASATTNATGVMTSASTEGAGAITTAVGLRASVKNGGTATVTTASAGRFSVTNSSTSAITNAYGVEIPSLTKTSTGAITNYYGLYIGAGTAAATSYGIYQLGSNNFLEGSTGIGTSSLQAGNKLEVTGGAIAAGSIGSGTGNAGQVRWYEGVGTGSNYLAFRAPDSIASDLVFTLPGTLGAANSVLMTTATGSLTWGSAGGGGDFLRNGTVSMTGQLQAIGGTAALPGYTFGGDTDTGMFRANTNQLGFTTAGTMAMTIDANGNVGVGSTTPTYKLDMWFADAGQGIRILNQSSTSGGVNPVLEIDNYSNTYAGSSRPTISLSNFRGSVSSPVKLTAGDLLGSVDFYGGNTNGAWSGHQGVSFQAVAEEAFTATAGGSAFTIKTMSLGTNTSTEKFRVSANGYVGVGTTGPTNPIHVYGSSNNPLYLQRSTGGQNTVSFYNQNSTWALGQEVAAPVNTFSLWSGAISANIFTAQSSGNMTVGGTITYAAANRLEVRGGAIAAGSIGSGSGNAGQIRMYDLGASGNNFVAFRAPDQITNDLIFTLPGTLGAANSVLMTDATGSLTWGAGGGGGGDFMKNGSVSMTGAFLAISGTQTAPGVSFSYDTDTGMFNRGANTLAFSTGGSEKMVITAAGSIGIGTANPTKLLHASVPKAQMLLEGTTSTELQLNHTSASNVAPIIMLAKSGTSGTPAANDDLGSINFYSTDSTWTWMQAARIQSSLEGTPTNTVAAANLQFFTRSAVASSSPLERMRITSGGSIGIGTTIPNKLLDVWGGAIASGSGTSTLPSYTFNGDGDTGLYAIGANTMGITAGGSLTMTIKANRVGINSTAPAAELSVGGDIQYTGVITDVSDMRLKKDIVPLALALPKVRKVKTYSYIMKDDPKERTEFGVLAQELDEIFPDLVNPITVDGDYLGVNYIGLIPWTIRALQELDVENQRLKAKNQELEAKVLALEKKQEEQQRMIQSIMDRLDKEKK